VDARELRSAVAGIPGRVAAPPGQVIGDPVAVSGWPDRRRDQVRTPDRFRTGAPVTTIVAEFAKAE